MYFAAFPKNVMSAAVILYSSCFFSTHISLPYSRVVMLACCIFAIWYASGRWKILELD
jgi:ABC-type glycerol-3-phosphate transport system permease component